MKKYYVNHRTQTIHIVGDFPKPKGNGFAQCGHGPIISLFPCTRSLANVAPYKLCNRCLQLTGE